MKLGQQKKTRKIVNEHVYSVQVCSSLNGVLLYIWEGLSVTCCLVLKHHSLIAVCILVLRDQLCVWIFKGLLQCLLAYSSAIFVV